MPHDQLEISKFSSYSFYKLQIQITAVKIYKSITLKVQLPICNLQL
jgi:hypothetical protein